MKQILRSASVCNGSIVYSLHRGRSQRVIVRVVPDYQTALYRIAWPDIGFSGTANLTRRKDAAREWAERNIVIDDRKSSAARREIIRQFVVVVVVHCAKRSGAA